MYHRPLCEGFSRFLDNILKCKPATLLETIELLGALTYLVKIKDDENLRQWCEELVEKIFAHRSSESMYWHSDTIQGVNLTANILCTFRHFFEISNGEQWKGIAEIFKSVMEHALQNHVTDVAYIKLLLEGHLLFHNEGYLNTAKTLFETLKEDNVKEDDDKAIGALYLYSVTNDMNYLVEASLYTTPERGLSREDTTLLHLWRHTGFSPRHYPASYKIREYMISTMPKLDSIQAIHKAVGIFCGEVSLERTIDHELFEGFLPRISAKFNPLIDPVGSEIVIGRSTSTHRKLGCYGTLYLGKLAENSGQPLSGHDIVMDAAFPHVIFICGHRGSGKSYTLGVLAEELALSGVGIASLIIDPIGIFWSMKYPNDQLKEKELLQKWGLCPQKLTNVQIFAPIGIYKELPKETCDSSFSLRPSELTIDDWTYTFDIKRFGMMGLLLDSVLQKVRQGYETSDGQIISGKGEDYSLDDMVRCIEDDYEILSDEKGYAINTRRALTARLNAAKLWGIFSDIATSLTQLCIPNQITVLDVSHPQIGENLRALIVGILTRKILAERVRIVREIEGANRNSVPENKGVSSPSNIPVTWLMIDEAHLLAPAKTQTSASMPLVEYAKQGRKPGCGLILCTQQPAATDDRILSQMDLAITHTLTYEDDIRALLKRIPTEVSPEIKNLEFIRGIPVGNAILGDLKTQKRACIIRIRPRITKHAGRETVPEFIHRRLLREEKVAPAEMQEEPSISETPSFLQTEEQPTVEEAGRTQIEKVNEILSPDRDDGSIPSPKKLDYPPHLLEDYLKRLLQYGLSDYLFKGRTRYRSTSECKYSAYHPQKVFPQLIEQFRTAGWETYIESIHGLPLLRLSKEELKIATVCATYQEQFLYAWTATGDASSLSKITQIIMSFLGESGGN